MPANGPALVLRSVKRAATRCLSGRQSSRSRSGQGRRCGTCG
jgi:hypothetical protein